VNCAKPDGVCTPFGALSNDDLRRFERVGAGFESTNANSTHMYAACCIRVWSCADAPVARRAARAARTCPACAGLRPSSSRALMVRRCGERRCVLPGAMPRPPASTGSTAWPGLAYLQAPARGAGFQVRAPFGPACIPTTNRRRRSPPRARTRNLTPEATAGRRRTRRGSPFGAPLGDSRLEQRGHASLGRAAAARRAHLVLLLLRRLQPKRWGFIECAMHFHYRDGRITSTIFKSMGE
jgi:hypothetical protein